jgi:hypothetical protein
MKGMKIFTTGSSSAAPQTQANYRNAMLQQRKVKPEDFPINNRAARRRLAKGLKPGEEVRS